MTSAPNLTDLTERQVVTSPHTLPSHLIRNAMLIEIVCIVFKNRLSVVVGTLEALARGRRMVVGVGCDLC